MSIEGTGFTPIVPGPAEDDGKGRTSAYDTTWPEMHKRPAPQSPFVIDGVDLTGPHPLDDE